MSVELTKSIEVGSGGKIELVFPELQQGQQVEVHVVTNVPSGPRPAVFGRLKGLVIIHDKFDDPLPEFDEYM